jgi:hypothetical protein
MTLTCSSTELAIHQTSYSQAYRKANKFQKLTETDKKVRSVKRCIHCEHVGRQSVRSYRLTRLLNVANQPSFGVGINTTFLTTVRVLFTIITVAKAEPLWSGPTVP